jgi:hypothetical protein
MGNAQMNANQLADNVIKFVSTKPELQTANVAGALIGYLYAACGPSKPD